MPRALHATLAGGMAVVCAVVGCTAPQIVRRPSTALVGEVTPPRAVAPPREEAPPREIVVAYARRYVELRWEARPEHAVHGLLEGEGIRIDTPDDSFVRGGWSLGSNVGVPYSWGGFDTPDEFVRKLEADHPAGYVERTRAARGSAYAAGVDCSGLVSRSWGLPRKYGTRELPEVGTVIEDIASILPGDILNKPAGHVLLFVGFGDATRSTLKVIEAGAWDGRAWKVVESEYTAERLSHDGFVPLRDRRRPPGT